MPGIKESIDFEKILIFKSGVFNNIKTTDEHLESMVEFQNDHQNIYADLKFDHIDDVKQRNELYKFLEKVKDLSLGKVKKLEYSKQGNKPAELYGNYINVNETVKYGLDKKHFTTHSAEIYYNVKSKTTGKFYKAVLSAVAILPAGKFPALMEAFEPYMYQLENNETVLSELNQTEFAKSFEFESKIVCNLNIEKENSMTKEAYEKKMQKYVDMGMKIKPFEAYEKMTDEEKEAYSEVIEKQMKKAEATKKFELEGVGTVPEQTETLEGKKDFTLNDLESLIKSVNSSTEKENETVKTIYSVLNGIKKQSDERVNLLESQLKDINSEKKAFAVENLVDFLIKSETPKLLPAQRTKAIYALMAQDQATKANYNYGSETVAKSSYDLIVDLLDSFPEIKQVFSETSIVANNKGVSEDIKPFKTFYSKSMTDEEQTAMHKRVVAQANEMGLSLSLKDPASFENYAMAKDAIEILDKKQIPILTI